jgi:heme-degrading monooxygenase HmoA
VSCVADPTIGWEATQDREVEMFARKVSARLKPDSQGRFAHLMETEVLPWLREQEGFLDLVTLAAPDGQEVAVISFWNCKGNAGAYRSGTCPEALKSLGELLDGTPHVKNFEVVSSTFQSDALATPHQVENPRKNSSELGHFSYETGSFG